MPDDFDQFANMFAESTPDSLTESERARMQTLLSEYAAFRPVPAHPPFGVRRLFDARIPHRKTVFAAAATACFVLASTGVTFAAEGTLPGDLLYGVKVDVVEPLQTAFVFSPQAQASWQQTLAMRRLDEAATLASKGKLSVATEHNLVARFSASANAATQNTQANSGADPGEVAVLSTAFSAQLIGYQEVFNHLGSHTGASTTAIVAAIQAHDAASGAVALAPTTKKTSGAHKPVTGTTHTFSAMRAGTSAPTTLMAPAESTTSISIVMHLHAAATQALNASSALITSAVQSVGSSTAAQARTQLMSAQTAVQQGEALLAQHDDADAMHAFSLALGVSEKILVLMHAAQSLKIDVFSSTTPEEQPSAAASTATTTLPQNSATTSANEGSTTKTIPDKNHRATSSESSVLHVPGATISGQADEHSAPH